MRKTFFIISAIVLVVFGVLCYGAFRASERNEILNTGITIGLTVPSDYVKRTNRIVYRIRNSDYGLGYAPWNQLMTIRFLASSIGSLVHAYPQDATFRSNALEILSESYRSVNSNVIQSSFFESGTLVPFGIIYQSGRLLILEQLAILDATNYQELFLSECDNIAAFLLRSPRLTAESYPGWGWYIDNADVYHALWRADLIREELGKPKRYEKLIASWILELSTHIGATGLPLAEAYRSGDNSDSENQVRGSATGWLLWILHDIDPDLTKKFFEAYQSEFADSYGKYLLIRDIPRNEKKINNVFDGPKLGPYSSSATILSAPIFAIFNREGYRGLLRTFDTFLIAPPNDIEDPDWFFGGSVLLDVLRLWAEVSPIPALNMNGVIMNSNNSKRETM